MGVYPVVMCGGAGTRLWPESRAACPKQFLPLTGTESLFQAAVRRVAPLATDGGRVLIVSGADHEVHVRRQLAEIGISAILLLEPSGRESGPAMAAAAAWIVKHDPDGVAAVVASDHHIDDAAMFQAAVREAVIAAQDGHIVTLGVCPTEPSSAYGYIHPEGPGLARVQRFVEKPDAVTAQTYIEAGYLWNSGNFIVSAAVLLDELDQHVPEISRVAREAVSALSVTDGGHLGEIFSTAPKKSIDYAVMERTTRAMVLPVDFAWSDLGSWDAVREAGGRRRGSVIAIDSEDALIRAAPGVTVAALGVKNLAIVAQRDAILVCDLSRSQDVKLIVEGIRAADIARTQALDPVQRLTEQSQAFRRWLKVHALPVWATIGTTTDGGFVETLTEDGTDPGAARRARVQARQVWTYCRAGALGWKGPWRSTAARGLQHFRTVYRRPDGRVRTLASPDGLPLEETAKLYDQAFSLLAGAAAAEADIDAAECRDGARRLLAHLKASRASHGGWREEDDQPFQSNPHMHLLEAALAWEATGRDEGWSKIADEVVTLALSRFVDPATGTLGEYFTVDWRPAPGRPGALVEPGHQFEWAWLLARYGRMRGRLDCIEQAQALYVVGAQAVSSVGLAVNLIERDGTVVSGAARLWPQTERLKAALLLAELSVGQARDGYVSDAAAAMDGLWRYLRPSGLWYDTSSAGGLFKEEAAPASSLYHIMGAFEQIVATTTAMGMPGYDALSLG